MATRHALDNEALEKPIVKVVFFADDVGVLDLEQPPRSAKPTARERTIARILNFFIKILPQLFWLFIISRVFMAAANHFKLPQLKTVSLFLAKPYFTFDALFCWVW
jgi:hypothetical protein